MVGAQACILGHEEETGLKKTRLQMEEAQVPKDHGTSISTQALHPGSFVREKQVSNLLDLLLFVGLLYNS